jgi:hypothetical protein
MKQIHKEYVRPFMLEKTKLDRIMAVIHSRLGEYPGAAKHDDFEVFLSSQRREEMTSIDDVLKLDNSRKSKILRLLIKCCASTEGASRPEHEIQVDFDGRADYTSKAKAKVSVSVRSDDTGWSDRALSEVEEQVERTSLRDGSSRATLLIIALSLLIVLLFLVLSSLTSVNDAFRDADGMWLRSRNVDRVEQILKQDRTITGEEMREINTMQLHNVLEAFRKSQPVGWTRQKTFVGVPLLIVLACAGYLGVVCYPAAVFLWGDEVERNHSIIQRRRVIWGIIIGLAVVGVSSKLLVMGLFPGP